MNFDEASLSDAAVARLDACSDPRFKHVMTSLIRHLHSFVRDVEPTEQEWYGFGVMTSGIVGVWVCDARGLELLMRRRNHAVLHVNMMVTLLTGWQPSAS
jgi:hypothetical protein